VTKIVTHYYSFRKIFEVTVIDLTPRIRKEAVSITIETVASMSQSKYARHRQVSRQRIYQLVKQGIIILDESGKIDPEKTDVILDAYLDPFKRNNTEYYNNLRREKEEQMGVNLRPSNLVREQDYNDDDGQEDQDYDDGQARRKEILSIIRTTYKELMEIPLELCGQLALRKNPIEIKDILENRLYAEILQMTKSLAEFQF